MTTVEIIRLRLELNRSMRAREDAVAFRLLERIETRNRDAERRRQAERERFARQAAAVEFGAAKRRRS